jgi:hypothetical protein
MIFGTKRGKSQACVPLSTLHDSSVCITPYGNCSVPISGKEAWSYENMG